MPTVINLPSYLTLRSSVSTIAIGSRILAANDDLILNATALKFADPFGIAVLGSCFHAVQRRGQSIVIDRLSPDVAGFLERMNLFKGVKIRGCNLARNARHDRTDSLVELTCITDLAQIASSAYDLAKALIGRSGLDPNEPYCEMTCTNQFEDASSNLEYALTELLDNSLTHARRCGYQHAKVWVASQYYPKNGSLCLGIIDNGCGFLGSLRAHEKLEEYSHQAAIRLALQPYVSCNRDLGIHNDSANEGVGLTTTTNIIRHTRGRMLLVSGNCCHNLNGESVILSDETQWQGVAIGIQCSRDALARVRYSEHLPPRREVRQTYKPRYEN